MDIAIGERVRVVGMKSARASAFNGKIGRVTAWDADKARATVALLDTDETLPLKLCNIEREVEAARTAASSAAPPRSPASSSTTDVAPAAIGSRVRVVGLSSSRASAHNGRVGRVVGRDAERARASVELGAGGEKLSLKLANIEAIADDAQPEGAPEGAPPAAAAAPAAARKKKAAAAGGLNFGRMFSQPGALSAKEPDVVWAGGARPRVWFELRLGDEAQGRVVFELYPDSSPKAAENFRCLRTGERGVSRRSRRRLSYAGCEFHALADGLALFGGDISKANDGKGGECIWGDTFEDRSGTAPGAPKHDAAGLLSMGSPGDKPPGYDAQEWYTAKQRGEAPRDWPNFGSRFAVYLNPEPDGLDGRHPVIGRVVEGLAILRALSAAPVDKSKGGKNRPLVPLVIADCGQLLPDEPRQGGGVVGRAGEQEAEDDDEGPCVEESAEQ